MTDRAACRASTHSDSNTVHQGQDTAVCLQNGLHQHHIVSVPQAQTSQDPTYGSKVDNTLKVITSVCSSVSRPISLTDGLNFFKMIILLKNMSGLSMVFWYCSRKPTDKVGRNYFLTEGLGLRRLQSGFRHCDIPIVMK